MNKKLNEQFFTSLLWKQRPLHGSGYLTFIENLVSVLFDFFVVVEIETDGRNGSFSKVGLEDIEFLVAGSQPVDWVFTRSDGGRSGFSPEARPSVGFSNRLRASMNETNFTYLDIFVGSHDRTENCSVVAHFGDLSFSRARTLFERLVVLCDPQTACLSTSYVDDDLDQGAGELKVGLVTFAKEQPRSALPNDLSLVEIDNGWLVLAPDGVVSMDSLCWLRSVLNAQLPAPAQS